MAGNDHAPDTDTHTSTDIDKTPNPLWAIAVGMAVFFALAGLVIGQS
jgi:hypothetical protein